MATFLSDFIQSLDNNWEEVDTLLIHAEEVKDTNQKLYNALCRSVTILIVAHLEGFIKDLIKNIIQDINLGCDFSNIPEALKRTYCKSYLGSNLDNKDKNYETKINRLIEKFNGMDCSISHEPFLFPVNKNPNPHIINVIFNNIGIKNIFSCLHESELESIFSASASELVVKSNMLKEEINEMIGTFPYDIGAEKYNLQKKVCLSKTIWEEFLDDINHKRHSVAHGNEFNNSDDVSELKMRKIKVVILQQLLVFIICQKITSGISHSTTMH